MPARSRSTSPAGRLAKTAALVRPVPMGAVGSGVKRLVQQNLEETGSFDKFTELVKRADEFLRTYGVDFKTLTMVILARGVSETDLFSKNHHVQESLKSCWEWIFKWASDLRSVGTFKSVFKEYGSHIMAGATAMMTPISKLIGVGTGFSHENVQGVMALTAIAIGAYNASGIAERAEVSYVYSAIQGETFRQFISFAFSKFENVYEKARTRLDKVKSNWCTFLFSFLVQALLMYLMLQALAVSLGGITKSTASESSNQAITSAAETANKVIETAFVFRPETLSLSYAIIHRLTDSYWALASSTAAMLAPSSFVPNLSAPGDGEFEA